MFQKTNISYPLIRTRFSENFAYVLNEWSLIITFVHNPFHNTGLFLYPLKISENYGYRKRPVVWNGLKKLEFFIVAVDIPFTT